MLAHIIDSVSALRRTSLNKPGIPCRLSDINLQTYSRHHNCAWLQQWKQRTDSAPSMAESLLRACGLKATPFACKCQECCHQQPRICERRRLRAWACQGDATPPTGGGKARPRFAGVTRREAAAATAVAAASLALQAVVP